MNNSYVESPKNSVAERFTLRGYQPAQEPCAVSSMSSVCFPDQVAHGSGSPVNQIQRDVTGLRCAAERRVEEGARATTSRTRKGR